VIRAIVNAARSVRILNRMTAEEAKLPKIGAEDRRLNLRVSRDKVNLVPAGKAMWVHLVD
jgi:DNA-directed RNA polymerase subunit H (RpoH/RPB5)